MCHHFVGCLRGKNEGCIIGKPILTANTTQIPGDLPVLFAHALTNSKYKNIEYWQFRAFWNCRLAPQADIGG
jgi:hypothetical protein